MKKLVENGQVAFDGIHTQNELTEMAFIRLERFERALEMLKDTNLAIAEQIERYVSKND